MGTVKFRGINRADSFDELAHVDNVPAGLRQIVHEAIDRLNDAEIEVEFNFDSLVPPLAPSVAESGISASVTVKVLGPAKQMPMTYTRDQIVEARDRRGGIPKG